MIWSKTEIKASLDVDINGIFEFKVEPLHVKSFEAAVSKLSKDVSEKLMFAEKPMIIFTENECSIKLKKDEEGKLFVHQWHIGFWILAFDKIRMYIGFADNKPIIGEAAQKMIGTKPTFFVYGKYI